MDNPVPEYLNEVLEASRSLNGGEVAGYIPELAQADPERYAAAMCMMDGTLYASGDTEVEFSIQSISKPFAYALALADHGLEAVLAKVGVEPSGEAFNEISLEPDTGRPRNPMINAGAITVHSLVDAERVRTGFAAFAGRELSVDKEVYSSELATADRNHAIAYMLRNHGILEGDPHEIVDGYTEQCSYLVTVSDLAVMGVTLANGGKHPTTGEQVVPRWAARQALSVMTTCGMYDAAGDWFTTVGIPAKSGVSGGLLGTLPGKGSAAVLSPRLDEHGNSVRGIAVLERIASDMGLHLMEVPPPPKSLVQGKRFLEGGPQEGDEAWVYDLQGTLDFPRMERLMRDLADDRQQERVLFDLTNVHEILDVGRRMLLEAGRRLLLEDREVLILDPDDLLGAEDSSIDAGDGQQIRVVTSC